MWVHGLRKVRLNHPNWNVLWRMMVSRYQKLPGFEMIHSGQKKMRYAKRNTWTWKSVCMFYFCHDLSYQLYISCLFNIQPSTWPRATQGTTKTCRVVKGFTKTFLESTSIWSNWLPECRGSLCDTNPNFHALSKKNPSKMTSHILVSSLIPLKKWVPFEPPHLTHVKNPWSLDNPWPQISTWHPGASVVAGTPGPRTKSTVREVKYV